MGRILSLSIGSVKDYLAKFRLVESVFQSPRVLDAAATPADLRPLRTRLEDGDYWFSASNPGNSPVDLTLAPSRALTRMRFTATLLHRTVCTEPFHGYAENRYQVVRWQHRKTPCSITLLMKRHPLKIRSSLKPGGAVTETPVFFSSLQNTHRL